jgi:GNAT superfamily N-acetyltransferase
MLAAALLLLPALSLKAAVLVEAPRVPGLAAPAAVLAPSLASPLTAAALPSALAAPSSPVSIPASAPAPAPAAPALVERRGRDNFGRDVVVLDAVDPAAPSRGTIGHVDFSLGMGQAQLDGPLDSWTSKLAEGAPEEADLTHFREHLWFGLAVLPSYRGTGLGARLMNEAVARMRAGGARVLFIRATESSLGFYKKFFGPAVRGVEEETRGEDVLYRVEIDLDRP